MNEHERRAWKILLDLGAKPIELGFKHALDIATVRVRSRRSAELFVDAVFEVVGRSGANRRHVNRAGRAVFVVTDDESPPTTPKSERAKQKGPLPCPRCGKTEDAVPATNYGRKTGGIQYRCCGLTTWPKGS